MIGGRVLDPNGKPFAGAKLYATIKSAESKPPRLKDPNQKVYEVEERKGKPPLLKFVHPKVVELMNKLGIGPVVAADDPRLRSPEAEKGMARLWPEIYETHPAMSPTVRMTTKADGRFRFGIPKSELQAPFEEDVSVIAVDSIYGAAWNMSKEPGALADVELRLAKDLPIHGRIVDSQGKPVAGAKVKMGAVLASPDGNVGFWAELVQSHATRDNATFNRLLADALAHQFPGSRLQLFPHDFTTDADGRFTIAGIGALRVVFNLEVSAPEIGSDKFSVMTVPVPGIVPQGAVQPLRAEYRTYGATFEHVVQPVQIVAGTVRDMATGQPVPNVQVTAWGPAYVDTFTDEQGKYQLVGLSKADEYRVTAWPWDNRRSRQPYVTLEKNVQGQDQGDTVTADFDLIRGVVLRGKLTDKRTGKPVAKAQIHYAAFKDNPLVSTLCFVGNPKFPIRNGEFPIHYDAPMMRQTHAETGPDGSFDMIVLPGPGVLAAVPDGNQLPQKDRYRTSPFEALKQDPKLLERTVPDLSSGWDFKTYKLFEVPGKADEMTTEIEVESKP